MDSSFSVSAMMACRCWCERFSLPARIFFCIFCAEKWNHDSKIRWTSSGGGEHSECKQPTYSSTFYLLFNIFLTQIKFVFLSLRHSVVKMQGLRLQKSKMLTNFRPHFYSVSSVHDRTSLSTVITIKQWRKAETITKKTVFTSSSGIM